MPINSTLSFLLLFSINSSVNYSLLLQQLFLTVVIIIFCCCLFSWTDCLMPFLSLLCFFVICIKTRNAISIVSSIHSALSLSKKLVKKKKKKTKKNNYPNLKCHTLQFSPFPLTVLKPDSTKETDTQTYLA